jgi:hypothetical protein
LLILRSTESFVPRRRSISAVLLITTRYDMLKQYFCFVLF